MKLLLLVPPPPEKWNIIKICHCSHATGYALDTKSTGQHYPILTLNQLYINPFR